MTTVEVDPYTVKPRLSATAGPDADPWNPWRTLVEKYPHVRLNIDYELPERTMGMSLGNRIWICKRLTAVEQTCTLAHELTHFELNSRVAPGKPGYAEAESIVDEVCARRLIPLRSMANVMIQRPDAIVGIWAWMLRVDVPTLTVRLTTLSPVDRQTLAEVRGGPLPTMPHYEPYDGPLNGEGA